MKKFLVFLFLCAGTIALWTACKKSSQDKERLAAEKSTTALQACTFETLSGDISSDRTLSASTAYLIDGCVTVKSGATLQIPAGTLLQGMKTPTGGGESYLIVERGGMLNISGTPSNPVIFTSDQAPGSRAKGDWGGLRIMGEAENNNGNALSFDLGCAIYTGGGTVSNDNSGTMQHFQVHFAGAAAGVNDLSQAAIVLNSVGSGTTFDHVQITNSLNDALYLAGGQAPVNNIVSYNTDRTDFKISYGNRSNIQFIAAMRLDNGAAPSGQAYGMEISNQPSGTTGSPVTMPVISNASVLGPNFCSGTAVNANYDRAVLFTNNGAGKIYNSVLSSWNTGIASSGLAIAPSSVSQTAANNLEFSYNSFHSSGTTPYSAASWTGGCGASVAAWITGAPTAPPCKEAGNQFSVATLGYDASFCSSFCSGGFSPDFTLGSSTLSASNFGWDPGSVFSHPAYRGAFGSADWTAGWTQWCPQDEIYCE